MPGPRRQTEAIPTIGAMPPARRRGRGPRLAAAGVLVALLGFTAEPAALAVPAPASADAGVRSVPVTATGTAALEQAYAAGRHLPLSAVGGVRAGSVRIASVPATGADWAVAAFTPSAAGGAQQRDGFQDGASTGVFTESAGGSWHLVQEAGPVGCGYGLPAAVVQAWGLAGPASCRTTQAAGRPAAARALAGAATATGSAQGIGQTIADTALSQVGVSTTPAVTSFDGVDCDPYSTLDGAFSPNSNGCGFDQGFKVENENEAWCSDFAKWAWQRSGVTADMNTLNAGADSFYAWALDQGESPVADSGTPEPGDAVVFYPAGTITTDTYADHVGIVASVNPDGTVNLVNGDFLGASGITVEYDTDVSLTSWASQTWSQGEQWVLVTPPAAAQQPAPSVRVSGPRTAVAGTPVRFTASGSEPGGSVTQYAWTFGDGRDTNATGAQATQVFPGAGLYTVTLSATSDLGTVTTRTWNVDVAAASSTVSSVPSDAVWYTTTPVDQYVFVPSATGGLAVDSSDGASWLQQALPGQAAAGSGLTSLTYADSALGDATTPHAYYRSADGTLAEAVLGGSGWAAQTLAGSPAAGSAIAAEATARAGTAADGGTVTPSVFWFDAAGRLNESTGTASGWTASALTVPAAADLGTLAVAGTAAGAQGEDLFYLDARGALTVASTSGGGWRSRTIATPSGISAGGGLSAVTTGPDQVAVFFTDRDGRPAEAVSTPFGGWTVREVPGTPARTRSLTATSYLLPSGTAADELFYLTASGQPDVTAWDGTGWATTALPGTATAVRGAAAYPAAGQPQQLFTADGTSLGLDAASAPGAEWTSSPLPSTPSAYPDNVLLYAATPADQSAALDAATAAGLPATQVTSSFATAWAATLSGSYLVISVGDAATDALYYNVCGWANPSQGDAGSTPFYTVGGPLDQPPGTDAYEAASAATVSQTPQLAADLAYYAVHGALPAGVTALPASAGPHRTCSGQAS